MKNLDLEKVIIILSLLLMPVAGGWIYMMNKELEKSEVAFRTCKATIEEIHGLHQMIKLTKAELDKPGEDVDDAATYFQNRAMASQKTGQSILKREEITVNQKRATSVRRGGNGPEIGKDIEVKIDFGRSVRGGKPLPRSFINAFIFNSEMLMPIWKLRNLKLTNKDFKGLRGQNAPKDLEISDEWYVNELVFARRKPLAAKARAKK
jgi:hypothetical protein